MSISPHCLKVEERVGEDADNASADEEKPFVSESDEDEVAEEEEPEEEEFLQRQMWALLRGSMSSSVTVLTSQDLLHIKPHLFRSQNTVAI